MNENSLRRELSDTETRGKTVPPPSREACTIDAGRENIAWFSLALTLSLDLAQVCDEHV